ncbi:hypothetical protein ABNB80_14790 [Paenibacillus larvae]
MIREIMDFLYIDEINMAKPETLRGAGRFFCPHAAFGSGANPNPRLRSGIIPYICAGKIK